MIKYAPHDYAVEPWWRDYIGHRHGYTDDEIAKVWARRMARMRAYEALRLYGPTHPQAR